MVGQAEEIIGPQSRLHIFKRDVVNRLAFTERMAQVFEHLGRRWPNIQFLGADS
jgi:hypothetical protein